MLNANINNCQIFDSFFLFVHLLAIYISLENDSIIPVNSKFVLSSIFSRIDQES